MRSALLAAWLGAVTAAGTAVAANTGEETAEARRHPDLHDPGGCPAEPRWSPRGDLCHAACAGAVLQRADPGQSGEPVGSPPISSAISAPRSRSRRMTARPTRSRSVTGVKFHDGSPLTAADVAASWHKIIFPPKGVLSARQNWCRWSTRSKRPIRPPSCFG